MGLSGNYKSTFAKHREWQIGVISNGESWPRIVGNQVASAADIHRLGIIPAFDLAVPTTAGGTSTAGTYGIVEVFRSTLYKDGLSGDDIQGNGSNIVDVTLTAAEAAVVTKSLPSPVDIKIDAIDFYAAQKIGAVYGTFYRVVSGCANSAGSVTFSIIIANGIVTGSAPSEGTADTGGVVLPTDNDFPRAQPYIIEVAGRLLMAGGIVKRVTATFTNGSPTVTTSETIYDGIEFWNIKRDTDTAGGFDGRGTYLCRYASANSVTLVDVTGVPTNYTGTSGSDTTSIWTQPNRAFSKLLNPHAFPSDNINNDYPGGVTSVGKVPNTNRVILGGKDFLIAEDYDRLPLNDGLNYISTEYGNTSHFTIVGAHGMLYWLDFSLGKREILMSDGSMVIPISTQKIKSILKRITLDFNADPWRVLFIHGQYYREEDTIRWALYLDNNTVANFVLELDLNTGNVRTDPQFYGQRFLDVFTYGNLRGRVYIGQFGYSGGIARIGLDNVDQRYRDWVASGTISGTLATSGQTSVVLTIASGTLDTAGDALKGIQVLVWQENTDGTDSTLITNPTYYHCRITANTATTMTIDYVETVNAVGTVIDVGNGLPVTPSGLGWQFRVGIIQAIAGPKWFTAPDSKSPVTFREMTLNHRGQNVLSSSSPIKIHFHENFDDQPRDAQYIEAAQQGEQVASTLLSSSSFARPTTNPAAIMGFTIVDNNANVLTTALDIETISLDFSEQVEQDDQMK